MSHCPVILLVVAFIYITFDMFFLILYAFYPSLWTFIEVYVPLTEPMCL